MGGRQLVGWVGMVGRMMMRTEWNINAFYLLLALTFTEDIRSLSPLLSLARK